MNKTAFVLLACWAVVTVHAARAETSAERGKRVVDEALKALGGDAFLHMQDRLETGRAYGFHNGELSGLSIANIYTRYLTRPEPPVPGHLYLREREALGKDQSDVVLFNELGSWELTWRGARPLAKDRYDNWKDSRLRDVLYILRQRLGEPGLAFLWQRSDFYENRPVDIVDISDARNRDVTVYFSQLSKLPVRQEFRRRNPTYKDFDTEVTVYAKYRDVGGGVMWPYDIRRDRNGEKIFEMYSDSVTVDKDLTDDLFTIPGNLKILKK